MTLHACSHTLKPPLPAYPGFTPQFTLGGLLGFVTIVSVWLSAMRTAPHWAIVLLAVFLTVIVTRLHRNIRRRMFGFALSFDDHLALASLATMAVMAWVFLYFASIGPAAAFAAHCRQMPWFVQGPLVHGLSAAYSPIVWLHDHSPLRAALDAYVHQWTGAA